MCQSVAALPPPFAVAGLIGEKNGWFFLGRDRCRADVTFETRSRLSRKGLKAPVAHHKDGLRLVRKTDAHKPRGFFGA